MEGRLGDIESRLRALEPEPEPEPYPPISLQTFYDQWTGGGTGANKVRYLSVPRGCPEGYKRGYICKAIHPSQPWKRDCTTLTQWCHKNWTLVERIYNQRYPPRDED